MAKIFVSYARADIKHVKRIVRALTDVGFDFWMDTRNLESGDSWPEEITKAIIDCSKFLLFMSVASMASDNVKREIQIAYENSKRILILRLDDSRVSRAMSYQLASIQWIDCSLPDWNERIAIALKSRAKPREGSRSHRPPGRAIPPGSRNNAAPTTQAMISELQGMFSAGKTLYEDQYTNALTRIEELRHSIDANWNTGSRYGRVSSKAHVLGKVAEIGALIEQLQDIHLRRAQGRSEGIRRELRSLLDHLNSEIKP
jgi:hypothetical protein